MTMVSTARSLDLQFRLLPSEASPDHGPALGAGGRPSGFVHPVALVPPPLSRSGESAAVRQLRASLEGAIAAQVTSATELIRAVARTQRSEMLPTTLAPFDRLLGGGLPRGRLIELAGRRSAGRFSILLAALTSATTIGEAAALIDVGDHFDPQMAAEAGVELERTLWIRPHTLTQAVMAAEMVAAAGFQLVVIDAGFSPPRGRRIPDSAWVRLARSAESNGTTLLVSSPFPITGTMSEASVMAERTTALWLGQGASPRVLAGTSAGFRLVKHRHRRAGTTARVTLGVMEGITGSAASAAKVSADASTALQAGGRR